ncbi:MAG: dienelactone hydrolase family protein [Planctomycetes bacterium]|nr:dienelactone hydrolase family protein [Planctomycetota bacterium]
MVRMGVVMVLVSLAAAARAEIVTRSIEYKIGDKTFEGYLAYDDKVKDPQPGVLLVHEWWGVTEHTKNVTRQVAAMGYVAFAIDMYGKGVVAENTERAGELSGQFAKNDVLRRERAKAGYDVFVKMPQVDKKRVAAIGFCFGGTTVLHMAYSGLDIAGVVSFHGALVPPGEADLKNIKARILVLHGAADPLVPAEQVQKFQEGVAKAKADWQMVYYGGAGHSFTNPESVKLGMEGVGYNAPADARSRQHMKVFFDEIFRK